MKGVNMYLFFSISGLIGGLLLTMKLAKNGGNKCEI